MIQLIDAIISRPRVILSITALLALAGLFFYLVLPREASPDVDLPVFSIAIAQEGISAEDAERLLVKPVESALRGLEGLKELTAVASPGRARLVAAFDIGTDDGKAFTELREKIAAAKADLPPAAGDPVVEKSNLALSPVMTVAVSGHVLERTLLRHVRKLKDRIESLPNVLRADLAGHREEVVEIVVDPGRLRSYAISEADLMAVTTQNSRLVAADSRDRDAGRYQVKLPSLFESDKDILTLPVKASSAGIVTLGEVADLRRTFKDATSHSRINGRPAIILQVVKRPGANVIDTSTAVRRVVDEAARGWPEAMRADIVLDQASLAEEVVASLQASILTSIALVMVVLIAALGLRAALMVGISIPLTFLIAFLCLGLAGLTINRMVLFGLMLTVGMLVSSATILVEAAQRDMARGLPRGQAYRMAALHMFWPAISSTATMLVAFLPLLFWPGVTGEFMSPLPVTVLCVLCASIFVALILLPSVGGWSGQQWRGLVYPELGPSPLSLSVLAQRLPAPNSLVPLRPAGELRLYAPPPPPPMPTNIPPYVVRYLGLLARTIHQPITVLGSTAVLIVIVLAAFRLFGPGTELFVETEPEEAIVLISARGNLSPQDELELIKTVEAELLQVDGLRTLLSVSGGSATNARPDQIGQITAEFEGYGSRRSGRKLLQEIRDRTAGIPGIQVEVRKRETGPPVGKSLRVEVLSDDRQAAIAAAGLIRGYLDEDPQIRDREDTRPLPGIEWVLQVNRGEAARFGADIDAIGSAIQMVTSGVLIGKFRPVDAEDELDIRARFPSDQRSADQLDHVMVRTVAGIVPMGNFVERAPKSQIGERVRKDRRYVVTVSANTVEGVKTSQKVKALSGWLEEQEWPASITFRFLGAGEDRREAGTFLKLAIIGAIFLIFVILVAQFDNFYQTAVTLSTVLLSVVGVLIGLIVTGQSFSVIMTGTAILALAGLVVNNAIILIDAFNTNLEAGHATVPAVMRGCAERLRPVMIITMAAIAALLPMALQFNFDFVGLSLRIGSITSVWWVQFATALIFGLVFSTLLTLILVPTLLAAPAILSARWRRWKAEAIALYTEQGKAAERASRLLKQPEVRH